MAPHQPYTGLSYSPSHPFSFVSLATTLTSSTSSGHTQRPSSVGDRSLSPGWHGSEESLLEARRTALEWAEREGWDLETAIEVQVHWGDQDAYRHVNNAAYFRWLESGRIAIIDSIIRQHAGASGDARSDQVLAGRGFGIVLLEISARYRRPLTHPDTVLIAHRVKEGSITRSKFDLEGVVWSYRQGAVTTTTRAEMRWYDHATLKGAECDEAMIELLEGKVGRSLATRSRL